MRQFFRYVVLMVLGFVPLLLHAAEKKLSKPEIRLSRLYFQEKYDIYILQEAVKIPKVEPTSIGPDLKKISIFFIVFFVFC